MNRTFSETYWAVNDLYLDCLDEGQTVPSLEQKTLLEALDYLEAVENNRHRYRRCQIPLEQVHKTQSWGEELILKLEAI